MLKKALIAGAVVVGGLFVLRSTSLGSLAHVAWKDAREGLRRAVPPDVQLKQLHVEIDKIDQDIRKNLRVLAAQEVECQGLDESVANLTSLISKLKGDVAAMAHTLEERPTRVSVRHDPLAAKLDRAVNTLENKKVALAGKQQLLGVKKQALDAAHERIGAMREQKEKLRVTAAKLETRLEIVRLKAVQCPVELDDSQVNRCNALATEIETDLREKEKVAELNLQYGYRSEVPTLDREPKPADEVLKAAHKALSDDEVANSPKTADGL